MNLAEHNIYFDDSSFSALIDWLRVHKFSDVAVIVDENTEHYCYPIVNILPPHRLIRVKSGEEQKNLKTCEKIWSELTKYAFDRKSFVINLGGGVIGDMGGFCAATYKRGVPFMQMPTTLLSMVDASVGGKLGIDFKKFKNHIGVFQLPEAVFIYPGFIHTLPERELKSGFAEIIKHCLIVDKPGWERLNTLTWTAIRDKKFNWKALIEESVRKKALVVEADPHEAGLRKILNFGHTLGHAIESYYLDNPEQRLLHGEAIAIGMICEAYISYTKGNLSKEDCQAIKTYICSIFGKPVIDPKHIEPILALTLQDKKNLKGKVKFALLEAIGSCGYDYDVHANEMIASIEYYSSK